MDLKQAKELVRSRLSDKRYEHTINVKKMAVKLAKHYGTDPEQAALAALLHDAAKELPKDEMRAIMQAHPEYAPVSYTHLPVSRSPPPTTGCVQRPNRSGWKLPPPSWKLPCRTRSSRWTPCRLL